MSNQVNAKAGLSVKDLVTTGIFTALLFVFIMVGGVFFATNPMLTFFMPAGSALLAGPVYLLMIAKVHKRWSITIMGVIMAIIWFVTGMHWAFALGYLIMAVVADFVAGTKQYKSKKINSLSYILFSLGGTGSYLVFFADPQGWAQTMLGNGTEQSYIDTMQATANAGIFIAMFAALLVTAGQALSYFNVRTVFHVRTFPFVSVCTCPADCCIGSALRKVEIFHKRGLLLCRGLCTDGLDHGGHDGDATDHVCCVPWTVP